MASAEFTTIRSMYGTEFGYNEENQPSVIGISDEKIEIATPILKDTAAENIIAYTFAYSDNLIHEENTDNTSQKTFNLTDNNLSEISFSISAEDVADPTKNYYGFIIPIDMYDFKGTPSDWICFNLAENMFNQGDDCLTFRNNHESADTTEINHNSSKTVDFSMANLKHTINGNTITFRWTALEGADRVDIFVALPGTTDKKKIGSPKMTDEMFVYTADVDKEHVFFFRPSDGGKEISYTLNAFKIDTPEPTTVEIKTATGPRETIAVVLILSLLGYGIYRKYAKN